MKLKANINLLTLIILFVLSFNSLFAQKNKKPISQNKYASNNLSIDGKLDEWPDSVFIENKTSRLAYVIANNDSTLFLAIKSTNKADLLKLLQGGISFSVNTLGQKKALQTITFPILKRNNRIQTNSPARTRPATKLSDELAGIKEINVSGFDQILDGKIAIRNEYGIAAAAGINENELLVCEYAIPMKLLQINALENDIFAYRIKVNGLNLTPSNTPNNQNLNTGMTGSLPQRVPTTETFQGGEFWIWSRLATIKNPLQ